MARRAHLLDTVVFLRAIGGWPAGTHGAVVAEHADTALVEVATEQRADAGGLPERDLLDDLVSAPYSALRVIEPASAHTH